MNYRYVIMISDPQLDLVNYMLSAFLIIEQQERSNYTTTVKPRFTNVTFTTNRKNISVDQDKNYEIQGKNKKAWRVNQAQLHSG